MTEKKAKSPLSNSFFLVALLILVLVTSAIYMKSLNNRFTCWDDQLYVVDNTDIRTLHGDSVYYTLKKTFTTYSVGNYHPLTMLSYCLEYDLFKLRSKPYHVTNFVLHTLNVLLVFVFIWLLAKRHWIAFITALLFAVHPMHVESVAWISERKDVLYAFFFLSALCTYLLYLQKEEKKKVFYWLTFLLFTFSCFSKGMAICFPFVLFAIDLFLSRGITRKTFVEKIPFLILSIIFGYIAIQAQKALGALDNIPSTSFIEKLLLACYELMMYGWKFIFPIHLSMFYNYPIKINGWYPSAIYISPFILILFAGLIYKYQKNNKEVLFGLAFFVINIFIVLKVVPVGNAIMADRYSYMSYIGLFFILGYFINKIADLPSTQQKQLKNFVVIVFSLYSIVCCYLSFQRTKIWKNSINLFTDAIEKQEGSAFTFTYRGISYFYDQQYSNALNDFNQAIKLDSNYAEAYRSRGSFYYIMQNNNAALMDYNKVLKLDPHQLECLIKRAEIFLTLKQYNNAIADYTTIIQLNPTYAAAYYFRGEAYFNLHLNKFALDDILKAKKLGYPVDKKMIELLSSSI